MSEVEPAAGWSLPQWLEWLEQGPRGGVELGLERVSTVLHRLQLRQRQTLTIAGTNGKGSCAHFAARVAGASGRRVGLYTSPHLLSFAERVMIDGRPVPEEVLCSAFYRVEHAREGTRLTYYEYATLAALICFDDADVELRVLEVGLGGRLDAVNAVDADACVITSIGLDHTRELGNTRDAIGAEKAGVARYGRPAVLAMPDPPEGLLSALSARGAQIQQIPPCMMTAGDAWQIDGVSAVLPVPGVHGGAIRANMAAAVRALLALRLDARVLASILPEQVRTFQLPGRQHWHAGLLLDVAHNAEAGAELAAALPYQHPGGPNGQWWLVLAMLADKPTVPYVRALQNASIKGVIVAGLSVARGLSAGDLQARLVDAGIPVAACHARVTAAIKDARMRAGAADRIIVSGSFYTVAEALRA